MRAGLLVVLLLALVTPSAAVAAPSSSAATGDLGYVLAASWKTPSTVASLATANGTVYARLENHQIVKYSSSGGQLGVITGLKSPFGEIAVDSGGVVYAIDFSAVDRFDANGQPMLPFTGSLTFGPESVATRGQLAVVPTLFDGLLAYQNGARSQLNTNHPPVDPSAGGSAIAPDGSLWFAGRCSTSGCLVHTDANGNNAAQVHISGMQFPDDVAVGDDGSVYVTDLTADKVFMLDKDGHLIGTVSDGGKTVAVMADGSVITERGGNVIEVWKKGGSAKPAGVSDVSTYEQQPLVASDPGVIAAVYFELDQALSLKVCVDRYLHSETCAGKTYWDLKPPSLTAHSRDADAFDSAVTRGVLLAAERLHPAQLKLSAIKTGIASAKIICRQHYKRTCNSDQYYAYLLDAMDRTSALENDLNSIEPILHALEDKMRFKNGMRQAVNQGCQAFTKFVQSLAGPLEVPGASVATFIVNQIIGMGRDKAIEEIVNWSAGCS